MLKLGETGISALRLGGTEIKKAYLGETVVFDGSEPPIPTYTVSVAIDPDGGGTVTGAGTYPAGETVTVTAAPGDGYTFTGWQENGEVVSEDAAYSFAVTGDRTLTAVFAASSRLPAGYTEVEYVKIDQTTRINTGLTVYPNQTKIQLDAYIYNTGSPYRYIFCARSSSSDSANMFAIRRASSSKVNVFMSTSRTAVECTMNGRYSIELDGTRSMVTINGSQSNIPNVSSSSAGTLYIGSAISTDYSANIDFYSFCVYSSGEMIGNFVPCKDYNGNVGFYDLVRKNFYKGGTAAGPAV